MAKQTLWNNKFIQRVMDNSSSKLWVGDMDGIIQIRRSFFEECDYFYFFIMIKMKNRTIVGFTGSYNEVQDYFTDINFVSARDTKTVLEECGKQLHFRLASG